MLPISKLRNLLALWLSADFLKIVIKNLGSGPPMFCWNGWSLGIISKQFANGLFKAVDTAGL